MAVIDHLAVAVPELDGAIERFASASGVRPAAGGSHPGMGTHNALASFGTGYVELIAPDPHQPEPEDGRPFGLDALTGPTLAAYAVRPAAGQTIDDLRRAAIEAGYEPGEPVAMSRRTGDDGMLHWAMTFPRTTWSGVELHGTVPFLIDWGDTPMPAATAPGGLELVELHVAHPEPDAIAAALGALVVDVAVEWADRAALTARLRGPGGSFDLPSSLAQ